VPATAVEKSTWGVEALQSTRNARRQLQDSIAPRRDRWIERNRYYYSRIKRLLRFIVEPHKRVLEVRCQTGGFLASVEPSLGVGIEISENLVQSARKNHPQLNFLCADPAKSSITSSSAISSILSTSSPPSTAFALTARKTPAL
jgi:SAM-dependent methyltransferase